jgi:hypothetical protein
MHLKHLDLIRDLAAVEARSWESRLAALEASGVPLNALSLAEAAKLSTNDLQAGVIETFVVEGAVLDQIPLLEIQGNSYQYNEEAALPTVQFRAVNSAYTESTGTFNQKTESLVILGGDADVDKFIVQTRGNLADQRQAQTTMKVKAATYKFQDTFINGDTGVDANSFDGLKKRLIGAQTISAGTNGIPVVGTGTTDQHAFFDKLDELLAAVNGPVDVLYMNASILGKIRSAGRRIGGWDFQRDEFGRSIDFYNGVPLRDIGKKADGTLIIPQTETQGSSSVASSIYAVRFGQDEGDQAVTGLHNGGVQVVDLGELQSQPVYRTRIEFYCGMAVFGRGAARLTGVLNS